MTINPSRPETFPDQIAQWNGTKAPGARFTAEQYEAIFKHNDEQRQKGYRGFDRMSGASFTVVQRFDRPIEPGGYVTDRRHDCPLLHETEKARLIITPNGSKVWIRK